jgi:hypothetical protein
MMIGQLIAVSQALAEKCRQRKSQIGSVFILHSMGFMRQVAAMLEEVWRGQAFCFRYSIATSHPVHTLVTLITLILLVLIHDTPMFFSCEYCSSTRRFLRETSLLQHQANSPACARARAARQRELVRLASFQGSEDSDSDPEIDGFDGFGPDLNPPALVNIYDDFPLTHESIEQDASPSSSSVSSTSSLAQAEEPDDASYCIRHPRAAQVYQHVDPPLSTLFKNSENSEDPYQPYFKSRKDWEFAHWAKTRSITNEAFDSLLTIPGLVSPTELSYRNARELNTLVDSLPQLAHFKHSSISVTGQVGTYDVFHCNPLDVLRELLADPALDPYMTWSAELTYSDCDAKSRQYSEMSSSNLMWLAQVSDLDILQRTVLNRFQTTIPAGGTVLPIILATDKTQLTAFSGEHSSYPVYMSIGNIAKHVRRQPSQRAFRLIGYLPTAKPDETNMSAEQSRLLRARLFHKAMEVVLQPLFSAADTGILLPDANGAVRLCFPILAAYVADYPEQCLVTSIRYGQTCPKCKTAVGDFGGQKVSEPRRPDDTLETIERARRATTGAAREKILKDAGLNNVIPFWAKWPHANAHASISPDGLHQVIQGVGAHLIQWLTKIVGEKELDARMSRLPPAHDLRNFSHGISCLSRISGSERKAIYAQILGAVIGRVSRHVLRATRALLDVIYIGQFECHSHETLADFKTALDTFHKNKAWFKRASPGIGAWILLVLGLMSSYTAHQTSTSPKCTCSNIGLRTSSILAPTTTPTLLSPSACISSLPRMHLARPIGGILSNKCAAGCNAGRPSTSLPFTSVSGLASDTSQGDAFCEGKSTGLLH